MTSTSLELFIISVLAFYFTKKPKGDWNFLFALSFTMFAFPITATAIALQYVDASLVSLIIELEVIFAVIISYIFLNERMHKKQLFGFILALLGLIVIIKSPEINKTN